MKILIGVDDSPHADAAAEFVRKVRWPKETQIVVLSSVPPLVGAHAEAYVPAPTYSVRIDDELVRSHEETAASAERILRGAGFQTEAKVLHGDPRNVLVELA